MVGSIEMLSLSPNSYKNLFIASDNDEKKK